MTPQSTNSQSAHRIDGATTSSTPGRCADEAAQFEKMGLSAADQLAFYGPAPTPESIAEAVSAARSA